MTATTAVRAEPALSPEHAYQQALQLMLQSAVSCHLAGQIPEAEQFYRAILQAESEQPQANHNLGLLLLEMQQPAESLPYLEAALAANPGSALYWLSYIDALARDGQAALAQERLEFAREHGLEGDAVEALAASLHAGPPAVVPSGLELQCSAY